MTLYDVPVRRYLTLKRRAALSPALIDQ
jgi:hypothetical protein